MGSIRKAIAHAAITLLVIGFISACSPERKLATEFTNTKEQRVALLFAPSQLFKTSLKTELLDSLGIKDKTLFDSVLYVHSEYLQHINDSLFIANYKLGFGKELKRFGFDIYFEDQIAEFMEVDSTTAYVINIAQLELEEVFYKLRDETVLYEMYYYHDHILNGVYLNSWFEISEVNDSSDKNQVYFASDIITDDLDGDFSFNVFGGGVTYEYRIDSLEYTELYEFGYLLGRTYAGYTYDLLLNRYLRSKLPQSAVSAEEPEYWRYDPYYNTLFPATNDRFIPLAE